MIFIIKVTTNKEEKAVDMMRKEVGTKPVHVAVAHADAFQEGKVLLYRILSEFNCVESWLTDFSPVMVYATGTGVLAISYYTEQDSTDEMVV